jgi:hypothetical protein
MKGRSTKTLDKPEHNGKGISFIARGIFCSSKWENKMCREIFSYGKNSEYR